MISNMQHQQYDSVVMDKLIPSTQAVVVEKYVNNNNNNNMNKNIHLMTPAEILSSAHQNPDVIIFDPSVDYFDINSSLDTKETITVAASQPLFENAPIIRAISIVKTTATDSSSATTTTTLATNDINYILATETNPSIELKSSVKTIQESSNDAMNNDVNVQKATPNHEYALTSAGCDWNTFKNKDLISTVTTANVNDDHRILQQQKQSQSDALRCIEDVHNYSKINRFDDSTNSSSPEEEDDEDDDDDDIDDEYDDDVFGATTKHQSSSVVCSSNNKIHVANSNCDSGRNTNNNLNSMPKQQSQLKSLHPKNNQNNHHKAKLSLNLDAKNSSPNKKIINTLITTATTTTIPSTSPKSSVDSPITPDDVPDDNMGNLVGMNGDKTAPDHHARRPMNAFLIFCKRHRAIVRDKYKNLENRQITKILGEWWATLSNNEKACYTELAKQYKDAFFKANPNFKWYKLPAPPLRTCTIRPGHQSPTPSMTSNNYFATDYINYTPDYMNGGDGNVIPNDDDDCADADGGNDRFNCDNGYVRKSSMSINNTENMYSDTSNNRNSSYNNSSNSSLHHKSNNAVGVFKLADEAQMGGLSSLLCGGGGSSSSSNSPTINGNTNSSFDNNLGIKQRQEALQNALCETSEFFSSTMPESKNDIEPFQNMRNHAIHMKANQILNTKRKSSDDMITLNAKKKCLSPTDTTDYDSSPRKASRSCKGKRYQELMISGQIISSGKKGNQKSRSTPTSAIHNSYYRNSDCHENGDHSMNFYESPASKKIERIQPIISERLDNNSPYYNNNNNNNNSPQLESPNSQKQFDASDFDLEEKIKALPAQCLDSYLSRKRETKKKKKIGSKRRTASSSASVTHNKLQQQQLQRKQSVQNGQYGVIYCQSPPKTIQEARDRIQSAMVGSQKRKARKESITRRDVNNIHAPASTNSLFEAVNLVNMNESIKSVVSDASDIVKIEYDPEYYRDEQRQMMTIDDITIKKEDIDPCSSDNNNQDHNGATTSDLLILAEVATNHIAEEVVIGLN